MPRVKDRNVVSKPLVFFKQPLVLIFFFFFVFSALSSTRGGFFVAKIKYIRTRTPDVCPGTATTTTTTSFSVVFKSGVCLRTPTRRTVRIPRRTVRIPRGTPCYLRIFPRCARPTAKRFSRNGDPRPLQIECGPLAPKKQKMFVFIDCSLAPNLTAQTFSSISQTNYKILIVITLNTFLVPICNYYIRFVIQLKISY